MTRRPAKPRLRELVRDDVGRPILTGLSGAMAGALAVVLGTVAGFLPLDGRGRLNDPCVTASAASVVPSGREFTGRGGRTGAKCDMRVSLSTGPHNAELHIEVTKEWSGDRAGEGHRRACAALAGLGRVRDPGGIGDEACTASDTGRLPTTVVLARRGPLRITLRHTSDAKAAAAVERDAIEAARRVARDP